MIKLPQGPDPRFAYMDRGVLKIGYEGNQIEIGDLFDGPYILGFLKGLKFV